MRLRLREVLREARFSKVVASSGYSWNCPELLALTYFFFLPGLNRLMRQHHVVSVRGIFQANNQLESLVSMGRISARNGVFAAIDLGSNSFHMVVAQERDGELHVIDRHKESVRLAAGLDVNGRIDELTQKRAMDCLERFAQRLRGIPRDNIRIVGTNALRKATNSIEFLEKAERCLEHSIEIISGVEEARLVYSGVSHCHGVGDQRRLVIDIGGGSSECIIGEGRRTVLANSLYMGCVSYTQRFFNNEKLKREQFDSAKLAAKLELHPIERAYLKTGWSEVFGSSGTIKAIEAILRQNEFSSNGIALEGLNALADYLIDMGAMSRVRLQGLEKNRKEVLPGGLSILIAFFERLDIEGMRTSAGALREGLLYETYGRTHQDDRRDNAIERLMDAHRCDIAQASRVESRAIQFSMDLPISWKLSGQLWQNALRWSARLYEIGLSISYRGYHKHGEYLIRNSELFGFSLQEKDTIATLIRFHRRRIGASYGDLFADKDRVTLLRAIVVLRLAVLLNRGRLEDNLPEVCLLARGDKWKMLFERGWLDENPLTVVDLQAEREYLTEVGIELTWV